MQRTTELHAYCCVMLFAPISHSGLAPDALEEGVLEELPDVPLVPDAPEVPDAPDAPDVPEVPDVPEAPDADEVAEVGTACAVQVKLPDDVLDELLELPLPAVHITTNLLVVSMNHVELPPPDEDDDDD